MILLKSEKSIAHQAHPLPRRHQHRVGLGRIPGLPQIRKHVKVEAGIGIFRMVLVMLTPQTQRAATLVVFLTSYRMGPAIVMAPMTIVPSPSVVRRVLWMEG